MRKRRPRPGDELLDGVRRKMGKALWPPSCAWAGDALLWPQPEQATMGRGAPPRPTSVVLSKCPTLHTLLRRFLAWALLGKLRLSLLDLRGGTSPAGRFTLLTETYNEAVQRPIAARELPVLRGISVVERAREKEWRVPVHVVPNLRSHTGDSTRRLAMEEGWVTRAGA